MYCPKCFNQTLFIKQKGVVDIYINGKKRDSGRFLFNMDPSYTEQNVQDFRHKCDDFFKWYSGFNNKDSIQYVELHTVDVKCESGCAFSPMERFSAVDSVISSNQIKQVIEQLAQKYSMQVELKF
jgi:hypothetical protein